MSIKLTRLTLGIALVAGLFGLMTAIKVKAGWAAQIPTGYVPTVTGSPVTAYIFVLDNDQGFANVRSGPGTLGYEIIGVLVEGQQVPAIGRTVVGDWILIDYPGVPGGVAWVWKDLVEVRGNLPIISPPPTITPRVTPTIDPTLAAQFLVEVQPTRLPTFTAPPALVLPTFSAAQVQGASGRIPMGFVIIGMGVLGIFGLLISFLRGR